MEARIKNYAKRTFFLFFLFLAMFEAFESSSNNLATVLAVSTYPPFLTSGDELLSPTEPKETSLGVPDRDGCFNLSLSMDQVKRYLAQWVISVLGVFGNSLVLRVYLSKRDKSPGDFPIIILAFVDLFMCMFSLIFTGVAAIVRPNTRDVGCFLNLCIVGNIAFDVTYTFSCGMICIMSVNRFLAVCRPHSYHLLFAFRKQIKVRVNLIFMF